MAKVKQGWISVHRQLQEHWLWQKKPFSTGQAWIDMLMMANHADNKFLLGNELVEVKSGSFITSEQKLADRWGWGSRHKVRNFLDLLQKDNMIIKKGDNKKTTITVENYSFYQDTETSTGQRGDINGTSTGHQRDTNNNDNNDNNINNKYYGEFQNVVLSDDELEKLKAKFPDWEERIEKLSAYMKSKGKRYKSHYATILAWSRSEKKETKGENKNAKVGNNPSTEKGLGTYI